MITKMKVMELNLVNPQEKVYDVGILGKEKQNNMKSDCLFLI